MVGATLLYPWSGDERKAILIRERRRVSLRATLRTLASKRTRAGTSLTSGIAPPMPSAGAGIWMNRSSPDYTKATTAGTYGVLPQGVLSERQKIIEAIIPTISQKAA